MKFNYHEWATRNVRPGARRYTAREHCVYILVTLSLAVICVGAIYWAVWYVAAVFADAMNAAGQK